MGIESFQRATTEDSRFSGIDKLPTDFFTTFSCIFYEGAPPSTGLSNYTILKKRQ